MSLIVLLDAGPLGMITNPKSSPDSEASKIWLSDLAFKGVQIVIPEIADYEVRRELLRAGKDKGIGRLDALKGILRYAPISTSIMLRAAEFWGDSPYNRSSVRPGHRARCRHDPRRAGS